LNRRGQGIGGERTGGDNGGGGGGKLGKLLADELKSFPPGQETFLDVGGKTLPVHGERLPGR